MPKLMTFNIRYGSADDGANHWDNRKPLVLGRVRAFDPDLIGMQECQDDSQADFIRSNLQEYEFHGVRRGGGSVTALEMAPILFRKTAYQLMEKGCFWLSENPHLPGSKSWGSTFPRTVTWVDLVQRESGREILFLNTHFDYEPSAIEESAKHLGQWISRRGEKHPVILTGDFNVDKSSAAYKEITGNTGLQDVFGQIPSHDTDEGTYHGFGLAGESKSIDWMLVSDHFEVVSADVDRFHVDSLYPSDHYPVTANLDWKQ